MYVEVNHAPFFNGTLPNVVVNVSDLKNDSFTYEFPEAVDTGVNDVLKFDIQPMKPYMKFDTTSKKLVFTPSKIPY